MYSKVEKKIGNNGVVNPMRNRQAPTEDTGRKRNYKFYSKRLPSQRAVVKALSDAVKTNSRFFAALFLKIGKLIMGQC